MIARAPGSLARLAACLAIAGSAGACELFSHASEYQIEHPSPGLCAACPGDAAGLLHVPCATGDDSPDAGEPRVFAARSFYFGHRDEWTGSAAASFDLGLDLDCSSRPDGGRPVLCAPADPFGWERLPRGVDNAWLQRILAPLYDATPSAAPFDLDTFVTQNHDRGLVGLLVTVDRWNGMPDDPDVRVSLAASPGVEPGSSPPRWNGEDVWSRFNEGSAVDARYFEIASAKGYVTGGTLVVDYRAHGIVDFRLATTRGPLRLAISDVTFVASITPARIDRFTVSGLAELRSTFESVPDFIDLATPCEGPERAFLQQTLPGMILSAADMPTDRASAPSKPCNAISFALAFDAEPARIGAAAEAPPVPEPACDALPD